MNTNRKIYLFAFSALFVTALFIIKSVSATADLVSEAREARAEQADVQRWVAAGEYYSKQLESISSIDAERIRNVNADRWQALGETYLGINSRSREADAARWQAIGEYYQKLLEADVARLAHANIVASARYTGLALQEYQRTGNPNLLPPCISADVAGELLDNDWQATVHICAR